MLRRLLEELNQRIPIVVVTHDVTSIAAMVQPHRLHQPAALLPRRRRAHPGGARKRSTAARSSWSPTACPTACSITSTDMPAHLLRRPVLRVRAQRPDRGRAGERPLRRRRHLRGGQAAGLHQRRHQPRRLRRHGPLLLPGGRSAPGGDRRRPAAALWAGRRGPRDGPLLRRPDRRALGGGHGGGHRLPLQDPGLRART